MKKRKKCFFVSSWSDDPAVRMRALVADFRRIHLRSRWERRVDRWVVGARWRSRRWVLRSLVWRVGWFLWFSGVGLVLLLVLLGLVFGFSVGGFPGV